MTLVFVLINDACALHFLCHAHARYRYTLYMARYIIGVYHNLLYKDMSDVIM